MPQPKTVIDAYGDMVTERIVMGFKAYLLTFMFNPLDGTKTIKKQMMEDEITATYYKMLTRMFRHPKNVPTNFKPMWIASPDLPVRKYNKDNYRDLVVNDGLHYHVIALIPLKTRLKQDLCDFIDINQSLYSGYVKDEGYTRYIHRLHCEPIKDNHAYVTSYGLKAIENGVMPPDDLLILPHSKHEYSSRTKWERQKAKIDGSKRRRQILPHEHRLSAEARRTISKQGLE